MLLQRLEIPVVDMERAFRFYADVMEFPVVARMGDGAATFFLGNVHGGMVSLVKAPGRLDGHGPVVVLATDGAIDEVRTRLEGMGVRFLGPTEHSPLGLTAYFLDSEGNRLGIFGGSVTARFREQARAPLEELEAKLREVEARTWTTLAGATEAQASHRVAPGEWSIVDQVGHIIDSLDNCGVLATRLAKGQQPPRDRLWQKEYPSGSFEAALAELRRAFADAYLWLAALPPSSDGQANLPHGVFGPLNAREWAAFMLFHVGMHVGQVDAIQKSPGYPG
jgi:predicted enzyme related to lactoylglutathione lyase